MMALPILRRIMELADEKQLVITALWVLCKEQTATANDLPARQVAQTFYATVPKPTVTKLFQAVEAARLTHAAADTVQLEAAMASLGVRRTEPAARRRVP